MAHEKADQSRDDVQATRPMGKRTWKLMDRAATVVGGAMATRATTVAWRGLSGKGAPPQGRHPQVSTREAVLHAIVAGAIAELVRTGIRRGTATYWMRSTGELPPGMKPLHDEPTPEPIVEEKAARRNRRRKR